MSGFGDDQFGEHPFGEAWWVERTMWQSVPFFDRNLDATEGCGALEKFVRSAGDGVDVARRLIQEMQFHRDPRFIRTRYSENVSLTGLTYTFVASEDSEDGRSHVLVDGLDAFDLGKVTLFWSLDDGETFYQLRSLSKLDNTLSFYAGAAPAVTTLVLTPPSMLVHLGGDLGVEVDGYEPDEFQRSSVYDRHKLIDLRGSRTSIEFRATLAGFDATVYHLWSVNPAYTNVYAAVGANLWQFPDGSGIYFSDQGLCALPYDVIPADVLPVDLVRVGGLSDLLEGEIIEVSGVPGNWLVKVDVPAQPDLQFLTAGRWYFTGATPLKFYVEPGDVNGVDALFTVRTQTAPVVGEISFGYWPDKQCVQCGMSCPTHLVRVELEVVDPRLIANPRALISAYERMVRKIEPLLPAHVKIVQFVFTEESTAALEMAATSATTSETFESLFDIVPADVEPLDQVTIVNH